MTNVHLADIVIIMTWAWKSEHLSKNVCNPLVWAQQRRKFEKKMHFSLLERKSKSQMQYCSEPD